MSAETDEQRARAASQRDASLAQVKSLRQLQRGWDGDDAPEPSSLAIMRTIEIVELVFWPPEEVEADAAGGVAMWFYGNGVKVMVGVRNDGRIAVCSYPSGSHTPDVEMASDAASAVASLAESLITEVRQT